MLENVNVFRFNCQKILNTQCNILCKWNPHERYDKVAKRPRGEQVQTLDTYVTATQHPHGLLLYCFRSAIRRVGQLITQIQTEAFGRVLFAYKYFSSTFRPMKLDP